MLPNDQLKIRLLNLEDWQLWKNLKLESLKKSPESFASSLEEEAGQPDEKFKNDLVKNDIFGAFVDKKLVGCAGFYIMNLIKTRHRGVLFSMYVSPEFRGQKIAEQLVKSVITHAKDKVIQLHLICVTTNIAAVKLYEKLGFTIYGVELRALKIGLKFFDEYFMVLDL